MYCSEREICVTIPTAKSSEMKEHTNEETQRA